MNDFDQAARFVAEMDPQGTLDRLLDGSGLRLRFCRWFPTNTVPRLQSPEREADNVAECDDLDVPSRRWLVVIEWQSRPDKAKLRTLLEEAQTFASRALGEDGKRFAVMPAIVHLSGEPEKKAEDMRSPSGHGLFGMPASWEIAKDEAAKELDAIRAGKRPWSILCWVPLMSGAEQDIIVSAWREALPTVVADEARQRHVRATALILSELARVQPAWQQGLKEESIMGESSIMNAMRKIGADQARLTMKRKWVGDLLDGRFPGQAPEEVKRLISQQDSEAMLDVWFASLARAGSYAEFDAVLRE